MDGTSPPRAQTQGQPIKDTTMFASITSEDARALLWEAAREPALQDAPALVRCTSLTRHFLFFFFFFSDVEICTSSSTTWLADVLAGMLTQRCASWLDRVQLAGSKE